MRKINSNGKYSLINTRIKSLRVNLNYKMLNKYYKELKDFRMSINNQKIFLITILKQFLNH